MGNSETALCFSNANILFTGTTQIVNNTGIYGGGVNSQNSMLSFIVDTIEFGHNIAVVGGAIYSLYGTISFEYSLEDTISFTHNIAYTEGGALYAISTDISVWEPVYFISNTAQNGGAMYLKSAVRLTLETDYGAQLFTQNNYATDYGGALYYEDAATHIQCVSELYGISVLVEAVDDQRIRELPLLFYAVKRILLLYSLHTLIQLAKEVASCMEDYWTGVEWTFR